MMDYVFVARPLPRRTVIGAAGLGALLAATGCTASTPEKRTVTVTEQAPPPDPADAATLLSLVFTTRLHVQRLTAAVAADERDAETLGQVLADRTEHLAVLEAEYTRSSGKDLPTTSQTSAAQAPPDDPDEILGGVRSDAATAQTMFTDALADASRFQAQLYASIAACVATHRMVLT